MKHLFTGLFAVAILGSAYIWTFGVPAPIAQAMPFLAAQHSPSSQSDAREAGQRPSDTRATSVVLQELTYRPYTATIQTIGSATSWRGATVLSETSGRVTEVLMAPNRRVAAGDVLIRLDDRTETLDLEVARAELAQAQSVMDRYIRLSASGNLTVTDVIITEAELALTQAKTAVGLAEVALDKRTIRAPFAGKLGLNDIEVGNLIEVSDLIVSVDDTETLLVEFELPERAVSMLELGRQVLVSTPSYAGRVFEADITAFDSRINSTTRTITVEARIDNTDGALWSGMTFAVRLLSNTDPMPSLPATALNWARHGAGIWVVQDGKAERHAVTIRFRRGGDVWVDTDVPAGATVVVEGADKLREGTAVEAVAPSSAPLQAAMPVSAGDAGRPATEEDPI